MQRHHFQQNPYSQSYGFYSSHVQMWELDHKEGWALKNWCFWQWWWRRLLRALDFREIKPVNPKGNQPWIVFGRTCAVAVAPTSATWCTEQTLWKRSWCWERLRAGGERYDTGWDGWMASLSQWTWVWASSGSWIGEGQGSLACCSPWGRKEWT